MLAVTAILFEQQKLTAITLTALWCVVFFFASAAASAAYLTVSEVFPLEIRAMAIAFFYAVGTGLGGILGPALFGKLIESNSFRNVAIGFLIAAAWLLVAAVVTWLLAVDAEQRPLEEVAEPLSATGNEDETGDEGAAEEPTHRERREVGGYPVRAGAHWSPRYSFHGVDDPLEGQIAAIERAAADADRPLSERELLTRTSSRHWGPGVARRALRRAVGRGSHRARGPRLRRGARARVGLSSVASDARDAGRSRHRGCRFLGRAPPDRASACPGAGARVLVVGSIHGNEPAGSRSCARSNAPTRTPTSGSCRRSTPTGSPGARARMRTGST